MSGLPSTIREIHDAYDRKTISATELTRGYLARAQADKLGAFLSVTEKRALAQAKRADEILAAKGRVPREEFPLLGIPIALKDALTVEGERTTAGSKILENYIPPYTATSVARLEAAGVITLGKTNLDEFAMGGSNENSAYGPVKHPTHPDRVPGGSSGGSAAAVKAGLCVAALGSDTGGSIRLPASYCGIVGMKPTYGTVSRYGLIAFASSFDQIGPMSNTVEDSARLLSVMGGHDPADSTSMPAKFQPDFLAPFRGAGQEPDWKSLRVGVPEEYFGAGLTPEVEKATREALKWFESKGAKLVPLKLPHTKYSVAVYYLLAVSEASSNLSRFDGVRFGVRPPEADGASDLANFYSHTRALFGAEVKRRILLGTFALSSGYYDAYFKRAGQVRRLIQRDFSEAFSKVDVIAGPVSTSPAFRLGEKIGDPLQMYLNDLLTIPVNLAGLPALSIPCGESSERLPIGLQLIGPAFSDAKLLSVAHGFERGHA